MIQSVSRLKRIVVCATMYSSMFFLFLSSSSSCCSQQLPFFIYPSHQFSYDAAQWSFAHQGEWPVTAERDGALIHRSPDLTLLLMFSTEAPSDNARTYVHVGTEWTADCTKSERLLGSILFYALEWSSSSAPARWIAQGNGWQDSGDTLWVVIAIRHGDPEMAIPLVQQVLDTHRYTTPEEMDLALFPSDSSVRRIDAPLLDSLCAQQENIPCSEEEIIRLFQRYPFEEVEKLLDSGDHATLRRMHCELRKTIIQQAIQSVAENRNKSGLTFQKQYTLERLLASGFTDQGEFIRFYFDTAYSGVLLQAALAGLKIGGELPLEKLKSANDVYPRTWIYRKAFAQAIQSMYKDSIFNHTIYQEFGAVLVEFSETSEKSSLLVVMDRAAGRVVEVPLPESRYAYARYILARHHNTIIVAEKPHGRLTTSFILVDVGGKNETTVYNDCGIAPDDSFAVWQPLVLSACNEQPELMKPELIRFNATQLSSQHSGWWTAAIREAGCDTIHRRSWTELAAICDDAAPLVEVLLDSIPRKSWLFSTDWLKCDVNGDGVDELWSVGLSGGQLSAAQALVFDRGKWKFIRGRKALRLCRDQILVQRLKEFSLARW